VLIAILNKSTIVSNSDIQLMCRAIQTQLTLHLLPAWNLKDVTVKLYASESKIPGHAWVVTMLDDSPIAGAAGYHSEDHDKIDAFVFCKTILSNGGAVLFDESNPQNITVSSVLSHEICEMVGDRFANFWADGPLLPQGSEYALEFCDPVESDSYMINVKSATGDVKVSVSNFIFPSWFNSQATTALNLPFDYLAKLTRPFSMSAGGYMIVRKSGIISQIFGEEMPAWRVDMKTSELYRR
jgi:hypothetical protein